jgi:hypothetical protein
MDGAKERHRTASSLLQDTLDGVEQASTEETAATMLNLQTRLQASYQTTSMLSQLSLVNYLYLPLPCRERCHGQNGTGFGRGRWGARLCGRARELAGCAVSHCQTQRRFP